MNLNFTKMHGLGNDFIVIDAINQSVSLTPQQVQQLADRHFGIGCDQLLLVEAATSMEADFRYRIYNADGGEVEQCGNGARCFMQFVRDQGLTDKSQLQVETLGGPLQLIQQSDGRITVDMGVPRLEPADIPFTAAQRERTYVLEVLDRQFEIAAISMGNPHAVLLVDDIENAAVARIGAALERHPRFPERVNVGFMQIVDDKRIRLRVFERGACDTLACGSGACAAVLAGRLWNRLS